MTNLTLEVLNVVLSGLMEPERARFEVFISQAVDLFEQSSCQEMPLTLQCFPGLNPLDAQKFLSILRQVFDPNPFLEM